MGPAGKASEPRRASSVITGEAAAELDGGLQDSAFLADCEN